MKKDDKTKLKSGVFHTLLLEKSAIERIKRGGIVLFEFPELNETIQISLGFAHRLDKIK